MSFLLALKSHSVNSLSSLRYTSIRARSILPLSHSELFSDDNSSKHETEEDFQTQLAHIKAIIQAQAIPATAIQKFSARTLKKLCDVYNIIDANGDGFVNDTQVIHHILKIRHAMTLTPKAHVALNIPKLCDQLTHMDFSGDGTLDLREYLHFATWLYDQDVDELITLSEHFATTTSAHGLGRVVNESSTLRRCFYLIAFLGSLSAFIWFTDEFLKTYYSYGTTSTVTVLTNYSIVAPRITICSTSYMRCDCALFYDPLYAVKYKLNQYQCGTKHTNVVESLTFRDDPCGSMYPGGVTEASAALISELTATGKLSETSLLEYARHKFVPSSSKSTTASSSSL